MKRVLCMPHGGYLSHVSRPLEVAKVLRARGHDVTFAGEGQYLSLASDAGFVVRPAYTLTAAHCTARSRAGRADWYTDESLDACVEADLEVIAEVKPDVVIGDFRLSLSASCELARVPLVTLLNGSWTRYYTAKVYAPEHFPLTRIFGRAVLTPMMATVKRWVLRYDNGPFRRLRKRRGLSPRVDIFDTMRGDLTLMVDIEEYAPTRDAPSNFHYVGPIVWEPEAPQDGWLDGLDPKRTTLYITMGSTGSERYLHEAFRLFDDYQCVMTTGGLIKVDRAPKNFWVRDFASGSAIMARADAVICQGGNGTVYQAMAAGVPLVGIPTLHDQEFNLDRVEQLGFGLRVSDLKYRAADLVAATRRVLNDPSYRAAAQKLQASVRAKHGPTLAADHIESL